MNKSKLYKIFNKIILKTLIFFIIAMLNLLIISSTSLGAEDKDAWVGYKFRPEQCVKIEPGKFIFKRKLCTIIYEIEWVNGLYRVNGTLMFDSRFVPPNVQSVDLEVLLISQDLFCTKQINIPKSIEKRPVTFSLIVEKIPDYTYIRTYYIIKYLE